MMVSDVMGCELFDMNGELLGNIKDISMREDGWVAEKLALKIPRHVSIKHGITRFTSKTVLLPIEFVIMKTEKLTTIYSAGELFRQLGIGRGE